MSDLTQSEISQLVKYDPDTGRMFWLERPEHLFPNPSSARTWNTRYAGKEAFATVKGRGYRHGKIKGRTYLAHRVAWLLVHGEWPEEGIDHISGVKHDNKACNLRDVPQAENTKNQHRRTDNSSGVTGVRWHKRGRKWQAQIQVSGANIHLGYYDDLGAAAEARKSAEAKYGFTANHGRG